MNGTPYAVQQKRIGDTVYIVESVVSDTAKESVYNKLKRLILNDTNTPETAAKVHKKEAA